MLRVSLRYAFCQTVWLHTAFFYVPAYLHTLILGLNFRPVRKFREFYITNVEYTFFRLFGKTNIKHGQNAERDFVFVSDLLHSFFKNAFFKIQRVSESICLPNCPFALGGNNSMFKFYFSVSVIFDL